MLFFDSGFESFSRALSDDDRFRPAIDYLRRCLNSSSEDALRIIGMEPGPAFKSALEGGSVAMEHCYHSKARSDCFFETHRLYIDVQCVLSGVETIDVLPGRELEVEKPYRPEKDVVVYKDPGPGHRLRMGPGCIAVFFPEDGHMPGQRMEGPIIVRKTVIKVPVSPGAGIQ